MENHDLQRGEMGSCRQSFAASRTAIFAIAPAAAFACLGAPNGARAEDRARADLPFVSVPDPAEARPERAPSADPRDISGTWFRRDKDYEPHFKTIEGQEPPFTAKGLELYKFRRSEEDAGRPVRDPPSECAPYGVPRNAMVPTPFQIIQTPGQVTFIYEADHDVRIVAMDKKQPAHPPVTWEGSSVAHWEGDTLVVDTIALRPESWLDIDGAPLDKDIHVVERYRKIDGGKKLEDVFTVTDPGMYTQPWTARREYLWRPNERVEEYVCEENFNRVELPLLKRGFKP